MADDSRAVLETPNTQVLYGGSANEKNIDELKKTVVTEGEVKEEIALFVADSDRALFRELEALGVELEYRVSFYNNPQPLKNVCKY